MSEPDRMRKLLSPVIQAAIGIAIIYFLFGGDHWGPGAWALMSLLIVWFVILYVSREFSIENTKIEYWNASVEFILALAVLIWAIWDGSLLGLALGGFLVAISSPGLRYFRSEYRKSIGIKHRE